MGLRVEDESPPELFTLGPGQLAKLVFADPRSVDVSAIPVFDRDGDPVAAFQKLLEGQEAMARLGWSPYLHDPKLPDRIRRYVFPAQGAARARGRSLVVWGEHDAVLGMAHARAWGEMLGVEPEVLPGAGHLAAIEQPDVVADLVGRFLAG
jgi:pimeloyl-ACP methyl ester carboxylesterase